MSRMVHSWPSVSAAIREVRNPAACMTAGPRHEVTRPSQGRRWTVIGGAQNLASSIRRVRLRSLTGGASRVGSQCGAILQHPVAGGADAGVRASPEDGVATAFAWRHTAFNDSGGGSGCAESEPRASHRQKQSAATIRAQGERPGREVTGRRRRETSFSRLAVCNAASILPVLVSVPRQPSSAGLARQTAQERTQAKLTQARYGSSRVAAR